MFPAKCDLPLRIKCSMTWKVCWRCIMRIDDFFVCLFLFCFVLMFARKIFCGLKRQRLMLRTNLANYLFKQQKETWKLLALFLKLFSNTQRMIRRWLCHWVQICELTHGPAYLFVFYFLFFSNSTVIDVILRGIIFADQGVCV